MGDRATRRREKAFTTGEVAAFCFVTPETILNWIRSERLPAQRTAGGQYRIRARDLRLFMAENGMDTAVLDEQEALRPYCWEFHGQIADRFGNASQEVCTTCLVRRSGTRNCWELHGFLPLTACRHAHCEDCHYFALYASVPREDPRPTDPPKKGEP